MNQEIHLTVSWLLLSHFEAHSQFLNALGEKTTLQFPIRPSLLLKLDSVLMLLSSSKAYVLAPWRSHFLSPMVFASLTVSGGSALVRALAGFHLSSNVSSQVTTQNQLGIAWRSVARG